MFVSKSMFQLMDDWRNFAVRAHEHNTELLQLAADVNETNKKCIAYNEQLSRELGIARSDIDQLVYKFECLLDYATGGRLSKHTHDLRVMESVVNDYVEKLCSEAYAEAKTEVARAIFEDLEAKAPWFCENQTALDYFNEELFALKKKYTGDNADG